MRVLVAPDSFGQSMSALEVAEVISKAWLETLPQDEVRILPLSDGGPGFIDVLASRGGLQETYLFSDPFGKPTPARILYRALDLHDGSGAESATSFEAFIESAEILGRGRYLENSLIVRSGSSQGIGEAIKAAVQRAQKITIGLGGTSTNDGGAGMLAALGGIAIPEGSLLLGGCALSELRQVDLTAVAQLLTSVTLVIATDVDNPLLGPQGATAMYSPQKGATPTDVNDLERALENYARVLTHAPGVIAPANLNAPGSGAAGGLGSALMAIGGERISGVAAIAHAVQLDEQVAWADLVVTGEGSFDWQSLRGKVVSGVAFYAQKFGKPVIVVAGQVHCGRREYTNIGIESAYAMSSTAQEIEISLAEPQARLTEMIRRVARTWSR